MQLVDGNFKFSFNYAAYDGASNLHLAASIYDITSGAASFVSKIPMTYVVNGAYFGTFQGTPGHTYLVITVVYLESGLVNIDPDRAPGADVYQAVADGLYFLGFAYAAYDYDPDMDVAGNVYDVTSGSTFISRIAMVEADFGVYFGTFETTVDHAYIVEKSVYTDNTYTTVDTDRAPSLDSFQSFDISGSGIVVNNLLTEAILVGTSIEAVLEAQC